jgi:putative ATP-binding cassette transporter
MSNHGHGHRHPIIWVKDFIFLAKPFWLSKEKYRAWFLLILVIMLNLSVVAMSVIINKWYNGFYDSIQNYDKTAFMKNILRFCYLAFFFISLQVLSFYFRKKLEIMWRKWANNYYITKWFQHKAYYKTKFLTNVIDNPDQRISEDINGFIVLSFDFTLGLLSEVVSLVSFVIILWRISGNWSFHLWHRDFVIHGYMVWVALLYAILGTYFTFKIGRPLIRLNYQEQTYEANFRYGLMRIREHNESIAFYNGEKNEQHNLMHKFSMVVNNFMSIVYRQMKINIFSSAYVQIAIIFPFVVAAPRYFAKVIKLGGMMQIIQAFSHVRDSFSYFINSYISLSGWRAVMDRLIGFNRNLIEIEKFTPLDIKNSDVPLRVTNLNLYLPNGSLLLNNINFELNVGDRLLIQGHSGCGKTTLLRTLAGIWHFANGDIEQQNGTTSLFMSQKPYIPIDNLYHAICYPLINHLPSESDMLELLKQCKLEHLSSRLNDTVNWSNILSVGEQQKIAFCRLLLNKPDIVYLDEASSALDEDTENILYSLIINKLPRTVIISVAHRSSVTKWHNKILNFNKEIKSNEYTAQY